MKRTFLTKTKNGFDVYVDLENSHAATHIKKHPELLDYMREILPHYEVLQEKIRFETDLGRTVGVMDLVPTSDGDDVFYAKRPNREKYTRFVRGKNAVPTHCVTIDLRKSGETAYDVYTVFIGHITPHVPYGKEDSDEEGRRFWRHHALVAGNQEIVPGTETAVCPW